ncbi:lytic transglycosylase domain-containing protein [Desulfopila sp. IMCC35006]|uniref:lytic transglycosylase domain-containing protein n=1 Tax=Desulfopila sp. IMCC35006 TaxID=2569542 RepID=UPI0010ACA0E3|nr:lytic transglycosylase domain-containing protein [Desulfopila sp. IMCC35006]TKB23783.1 lytic transglycosylase domain-containing protein [Desulfopila sp. IMCC35006]
MKSLLKSIPLVLLWLLFSASSGFAEKVVLPLTLDHKLLTSLLLHDSFTGTDQSAAIFGLPGDCTYVRIAKPHFSSAGKLLRLEMQLEIRVGLHLGEKCFIPVEWQGYLELLQEPVFDGRTFSLSFRTVNSSLLTLSRQPATVAGFLWRFAKPRVSEYLDQVRLDLAPPITDLRSFLAPLFHAEAQRSTQAMLDSLHGGGVEVKPDGIVVELLTEVQEIFRSKDHLVVTELTGEERQQLLELWDTWDAFLVRLLTTMATESLNPADRQTLIDVLLDTRYAFVAALEQPDIGKDFVRIQFVRAWQQLAPVFRRQLFAQPSDNSLGYLAFFTAADALAVFDRMGPTLGIEISQQGLLRLAGMLAGKGTTLPYSPHLDKQLRELLQLPPIDEDVKSQDDLQELDIPVEEPEDDPFSQVFYFFITPVYGASLPAYGDILSWKVPEENVDGYVARVRDVLAENTAAILSRSEILHQFHDMFRKLIPAMAWQESCFRQFIVKNNKLTYLLSSNQTSIGLMQINERVWRGLYDLSRLRWDIRYNALAGCEIADLYLRKYALNHSRWQKNADMQLLAQVVYAMYNGGPGEYQKFLERERNGKKYSSEQLFFEKLQSVDQEKWDRVKDCLVGG